MTSKAPVCLFNTYPQMSECPDVGRCAPVCVCVMKDGAEEIDGINQSLINFQTLWLCKHPSDCMNSHEIYPYLGHKFSIAGDWDEQVTELCQEYIHRIKQVDSAPLPVRMKIEAIKQIAVAKIQHLFHNVHISQQNLTTMNNQTGKKALSK